MSFEMEDRLQDDGTSTSLSQSNGLGVSTPPSESLKRSYSSISSEDEEYTSHSASKRPRLSSEDDDEVLESPLLTPSRFEVDQPFPAHIAPSPYDLNILGQVASELLQQEVFV